MSEDLLLFLLLRESDPRAPLLTVANLFDSSQRETAPGSLSFGDDFEEPLLRSDSLRSFRALSASRRLALLISEIESRQTPPLCRTSGLPTEAQPEGLALIEDKTPLDFSAAETNATKTDRVSLAASSGVPAGRVEVSEKGRPASFRSFFETPLREAPLRLRVLELAVRAVAGSSADSEEKGGSFKDSLSEEHARAFGWSGLLLFTQQPLAVEKESSRVLRSVRNIRCLADASATTALFASLEVLRRRLQSAENEVWHQLQRLPIGCLEETAPLRRALKEECLVAASSRRWALTAAALAEICLLVRKERLCFCGAKRTRRAHAKGGEEKGRGGTGGERLSPSLLRACADLLSFEAALPPPLCPPAEASSLSAPSTKKSFAEEGAAEQSGSSFPKREIAADLPFVCCGVECLVFALRETFGEDDHYLHPELFKSGLRNAAALKLLCGAELPPLLLSQTKSLAAQQQQQDAFPRQRQSEQTEEAGDFSKPPNLDFFCGHLAAAAVVGDLSFEFSFPRDKEGQREGQGLSASTTAAPVNVSLLKALDRQIEVLLSRGDLVVERESLFLESLVLDRGSSAAVQRRQDRPSFSLLQTRAEMKEALYDTHSGKTDCLAWLLFLREWLSKKKLRVVVTDPLQRPLTGGPFGQPTSSSVSTLEFGGKCEAQTNPSQVFFSPLPSLLVRRSRAARRQSLLLGSPQEFSVKKLESLKAATSKTPSPRSAENRFPRFGLLTSSKRPSSIERPRLCFCFSKRCRLPLCGGRFIPSSSRRSPAPKAESSLKAAMKRWECGGCCFCSPFPRDADSRDFTRGSEPLPRGCQSRLLRFLASGLPTG